MRKKKAMLNLAIERTRAAFESEKKIEELNQILGGIEKDRGIEECIPRVKKYLEEKYSTEDKFEYTLWGMTQLTGMVREMIGRRWKNARMIGLIDKNERKALGEFKAHTKEALLKNKSAEIIVCAEAL